MCCMKCLNSKKEGPITEHSTAWKYEQSMVTNGKIITCLLIDQLNVEKSETP